MASDPEVTCWTMILDAASGAAPARASFAERYGPVLESYLGARWRGGRLRAAIPDAAQEVFLEAYKQGGLLEKADPNRPGGFRAFLYGAARRVAQRFEEGRGLGREERLATAAEESGVLRDEASLTQVFDRAWAEALMRQAATHQREAAGEDQDRRRRVELLDLRFGEGLPIRDIATRWGDDPARVHKAYARAREEFRTSLLEVLRFHQEGSAAELEARAQELLEALG